MEILINDTLIIQVTCNYQVLLSSFLFKILQIFVMCLLVPEG